MGVSLILVKHDHSQVEVPLRPGTEIIGRHTDCRIRIPDASVSRQHCELSVGEGKVTLRDLGSSNGTFVNRKRITQTELAAGDMLCIGKFVLVVRIDGKPATIDAEEVLEDGLVMPASAESPRPAAARVPAPQPAKKPAKPSLLDDEGGADESSFADFDFLSDDDNAPKL